MNDNAEIPNPALRAHVTDHSFVLTMRKTHIAVLAAIANGDRTMAVVKDWVGAVKGLGVRGLVVHRHAPNFIGKHHGSMSEPITNYYRLTRAGWAVFDLLVEAGMIQANSSKRRLVA